MKITFSVTTILALSLFAQVQANEFRMERDPWIMQTPLRQLGANLIPSIAIEVLVDRRQPLSYGPPGDYYRSPGLSDTTLSILEKEQIAGLLSQNIQNVWYDSLIVANIIGYHYRFSRQNEDRREYYLRYSKNDTVFVVSGWFGKLFSFYMALPSRLTFVEDQLQTIIKSLSKKYLMLGEMPNKRDVLDPYFTEYFDEHAMTMVRAYHVREFEESVQGVPSNWRDRTVIQITVFLDKDVMP